MKKARRVGIFGGLFDPPHIGHLIIAQAILDEFRLQKIMFVPAGNPPHKRAHSPYATRYHMTELAIRDNPQFTVSDIERHMSGKTYTVEVVAALRREVSGSPYLIIGSDQWKEIDTWKRPDRGSASRSHARYPQQALSPDTDQHDAAAGYLIDHDPQKNSAAPQCTILRYSRRITIYQEKKTVRLIYGIRIFNARGRSLTFTS
jgi:nicotinate-nucleotide adenylyltransferase